MFLIKAVLRSLLLIGVITLVPYALWWIFTGWDISHTEEEIEYL